MVRKRNNFRFNSGNWKSVVGLTGGFGSGKSTALKILEQFGALPLDADKTVHDLLKNKKVKDKIQKELNLLGIKSSKTEFRKSLGDVIFNSSTKRRQLEKILHPMVEQTFREKLKKKSGKIAVCDVPLLYEAGWSNRFDQTIFINAPLTRRINWLNQRGFSNPEIKRRLKAQWPMIKKAKKSNFVINNDSSKSELRKKLKKVYSLINS